MKTFTNKLDRLSDIFMREKVAIVVCVFLLFPCLANAETEQYPAYEDRYPNNGLTSDEIILRGGSEESDDENSDIQDDLYETCPIFIDKSDGQPNDLYNMLQELFGFIKIATPALVIILSTIDYLGAIVKSNDDEVKKANKRTIKRVVIGLAIFFLPFLLDIIFNIFGLVDVSRCGIGS